MRFLCTDTRGRERFCKKALYLSLAVLPACCCAKSGWILVPWLCAHAPLHTRDRAQCRVQTRKLAHTEQTKSRAICGTSHVTRRTPQGPQGPGRRRRWSWRRWARGPCQARSRVGSNGQAGGCGDCLARSAVRARCGGARVAPSLRQQTRLVCLRTALRRPRRRVGRSHRRQTTGSGVCVRVCLPSRLRVHVSLTNVHAAACPSPISRSAGSPTAATSARSRQRRAALMARALSCATRAHRVPTEVQSGAIPHALAGRDVLGACAAVAD